MAAGPADFDLRWLLGNVGKRCRGAGLLGGWPSALAAGRIWASGVLRSSSRVARPGSGLEMDPSGGAAQPPVPRLPGVLVLLSAPHGRCGRRGSDRSGRGSCCPLYRCCRKTLNLADEIDCYVRRKGQLYTQNLGPKCLVQKSVELCHFKFRKDCFASSWKEGSKQTTKSDLVF